MAMPSETRPGTLRIAQLWQRWKTDPNFRAAITAVALLVVALVISQFFLVPLFKFWLLQK
jgi:uncharacterized membrane protein required for colicin V production